MFSLRLVLLLFVSILIICSAEDESTTEESVSDKNVNVNKNPNRDGFPYPGTLYHPFSGIHSFEPVWKASAFLTLDDTDKENHGVIQFIPWGRPNFVRVVVNATGLPPGKHAVHVHTFGDVSQGCNSTGPHMQNNFIGNIEVKEDGTVKTTFLSPLLTLFGYHGIVGRSVVIHEKPIEAYVQPDFAPFSYYVPPLNSLPYQFEENLVGPPIACGIITLTKNQHQFEGFE